MTGLGDFARQRELLGLTTDEMADLLGCGRRTLQRWLADGPPVAPDGRPSAEARLSFILSECPGVRSVLEAALAAGPLLDDPDQPSLFGGGEVG
jgi:hypothetical protein